LCPLVHYPPSIQSLPPGDKENGVGSVQMTRRMSAVLHAVCLFLLFLVPPGLQGQWRDAAPRGTSSGTSWAAPPGDSLELRRALGELARVEAGGGWGTVPPGPTVRPGEADPRVASLRRRLERSGDLPWMAAVTDSTLLDPLLEEAVRRFQARHGLDVDGVVGAATLAALNVPVAQRMRQVELNLLRRREFPPDTGRIRVVVNVPGFEAWVLEEGKETAVHRLVVGRVDRPTPLLSGGIEHVVLAPYWNVPRTIFLRDKLPVLRRDPAYLDRQRMTVMDRATGQPAAGGAPDWNQIDPGEFHERFWLRQAPGPGNALGAVKFIFPNSQDVYLHDTPDRHLFDRGFRSFSSGCMRIDRPMELAERLLEGRQDWGVERIHRVAAGGVEQWVRLAQPAPIRMVYWTAWVDRDGVLHLNQDLYGMDARRMADGDGVDEWSDSAREGGEENREGCG